MARGHKARPKGGHQRQRGVPVGLAYPVNVEKDRPGYRAQVPDFPAGVTHGDSREEALYWARDLLETMVSHYLAEGLDLPAPSAARGRTLIPLRPVSSSRRRRKTKMHC